MPDVATTTTAAAVTQTASPQQLQAITTTDDPLLVIADPGSGKTFTLVERIVHLITTRGVIPEQFMVVTVTDRAAEELVTHIAIRTYYPDFLIQRDDGRYIIVEVKRDDQIDAPVVRAKQPFAEQMARANRMDYRLIPSSRAATAAYDAIWEGSLQEAYITAALPRPGHHPDQ